MAKMSEHKALVQEHVSGPLTTAHSSTVFPKWPLKNLRFMPSALGSSECSFLAAAKSFFAKTKPPILFTS
jgi:hypothetical protein